MTTFLEKSSGTAAPHLHPPILAASLERMSEFLSLTAGELLALLRRREISSRELTAAHLERITRVGPRLNAIVHQDSEAALARAHALDDMAARGQWAGPLHGLPMTLKDSHDTAGMVTTWGTAGRRDAIPRYDTPAVSRIRGAGAVVMGKSNTPELTLSFSTDNAVYGRTENPWRRGHSAGGSSGGAAAGLASGQTALELGSDLGGSIRVPAHYCGVAGLKPTPGLVPRTGHAIGPGGPIDHFSTIGPMARSAGDLFALLQVISGPDGVDPSVLKRRLQKPTLETLRGIRVLLVAGSEVEIADAEVCIGLAAAGERLASSGADVSWGRLSGLGEAWCLGTLALATYLGPRVREILKQQGTSQAHHFLEDFDRGEDSIANLRHYIRTLSDRITLSPFLHSVTASDGRTLSAELQEALWCEVGRFRATSAQWFSQHELIVMPAAATAAPTHRGVQEQPFAFGNPINLAGLPSVVCPVAMTADGRPIGVQFVAPAGRDHIALAAAIGAESRTEWSPEQGQHEHRSTTKAAQGTTQALRTHDDS